MYTSSHTHALIYNNMVGSSYTVFKNEYRRASQKQ